MATMDPRLVQIGIESLPGIIAFAQSVFRARHPDDPVPSSEEVIAAYTLAYQSSVDKDDLWLATHPEGTP